MSVDSLPRSIEDALGSELTEQHLNLHSAGAGDPALFHAHGGGKDDKDAELTRFCRLVDDALLEAVNRTRPLVLAGVEHLLATYRSVSRHPVLVAAAITGNPDRMEDAELHAAAWQCLSPDREARRERAMDRFVQARASESTMIDLPDIVIASLDGRIDTLLFANDNECVWGEVDPEQRRVDRLDEARGVGEDLLDRAVVEAFATGADLVPLDRGRLPGEAHAVAITRY